MTDYSGFIAAQIGKIYNNRKIIFSPEVPPMSGGCDRIKFTCECVKCKTIATRTFQAIKQNGCGFCAGLTPAPLREPVQQSQFLGIPLAHDYTPHLTSVESGRYERYLRYYSTEREALSAAVGPKRALEILGEVA